MSSFGRGFRSPTDDSFPEAVSANQEDRSMPRYLIKRTFPKGLHIPSNAEGAQAVANVVRNNAARGVTWVHS